MIGNTYSINFGMIIPYQKKSVITISINKYTLLVSQKKKIYIYIYIYPFKKIPRSLPPDP